MHILSKQVGIFFFVMWCVLMPRNVVMAQTLEVVLSFPSPVLQVDKDRIFIQGINPDRVSLDPGGALHMYQNPSTALPDRLMVTMEPGALVFQNGFFSEARVMEVPLQQRTYALEQLSKESLMERVPSFIAATRSTLTGFLVPFIAFNFDILGYLRNLPTYLSAMLAWILSAFGLRKHKRVPWGTVYNAITKDVIPFAIVRLVEGLSGKVKETQVSDRQGRFGFVPPEGLYRLEVVKPGFHYPSIIVKGMHDGSRSPLYHRELTSIHGNTKSIISYIPMDPAPRTTLNMSFIKSLMVGVQELIRKSAVLFFLLGITVSVLLVVLLPTPSHMGLLVVYALMAIFQVSMVPYAPRPWGAVVNAQNGVGVPLASVSLIETKYDRVVKTRLTDFEGKFYFLPTPGTYRLIVHAPGYRFPTEEKLRTQHGRDAYTGEVFTLGVSDAVVNMDVPVDRVKK